MFNIGKQGFCSLQSLRDPEWWSTHHGKVLGHYTSKKNEGAKSRVPQEWALLYGYYFELKEIETQQIQEKLFISHPIACYWQRELLTKIPLYQKKM